MTINSVEEMWSRQTGGYASPDGQKFTAEFARAFQVVHSADATTPEILAAVPVNLNDQYPGQPGVYCTKIGDRQPNGPILSIVPVSYSGEVGPNGDNPLNQPPKTKYTSVSVESEADTDAAGLPHTNVNGELVDGIRRIVSDMSLTVSRNFSSFNGTLALQYMDSTNSDVFRVFGDIWLPGQAAMQDFDIEPVYSGNTIEYFTVSTRILFRQPYNTVPARAWWSRYRNEGFYERVGTVVTFASPGGSGRAAVGYPVISGGVIQAIVVTYTGYGYSSAPTVTITGNAGGSGASATAVLTGDRVTSVTIGAGGSGYKTGLKRSVDDNKEPVTKPVLLKANGQREYNALSAVWIERPAKTYSLSYNALGLL